MFSNTLKWSLCSVKTLKYQNLFCSCNKLSLRLIKVWFNVKIKGISFLNTGLLWRQAKHIRLSSKLIKAVADLELSEGKGGCGFVLLALLTFFPSGISYFLPKIRVRRGPSHKSATER